MTNRLTRTDKRVAGDYRDPSRTPDDTRDRLPDGPGYLRPAGAAVATVVATAGWVAKRDGVWGAESVEVADGPVESGPIGTNRNTFGSAGGVAGPQVDGDVSIAFGK